MQLTCPLCEGNLHRKKNGHYYCENHQYGCRFWLPGIVCGRKLMDVHIHELLTKGKTRMLHGLVSRRGDKFNAKLILTSDYEYRFDYGHPKRPRTQCLYRPEEVAKL